MKRFRNWNVYLNGKLIDRLCSTLDCDAAHVRRGLIAHDGYDHRIVVKED